MSSAYGHIVLCDKESRAKVARRNEANESYKGDPRWRPYPCIKRGCCEKLHYLLRYSYTTGRSGRVTDAIKSACFEHGNEWAEKQKAEFDAGIDGESGNGSDGNPPFGVMP